MNTYRTEAKGESLDQEAVVSLARLRTLERDEAILNLLETHVDYVDGFAANSKGWRVEVKTGEYCSATFYPLVSDGEAETLREAVEQAKNWEPVLYEPKVETPAPSFWSWLRVPMLILVCSFASFLIGGWR